MSSIIEIIDLISDSEEDMSPQTYQPENEVEFLSRHPLNQGAEPLSRRTIQRRLPMEALVQSHKEPSLEDFLRAKFRMDHFRPLQRPVIEAALLGRDCFVKFGGGVGKSLCFQFLSLYRDDTFTVVVSPLVSLIENQVNQVNAALGSQVAIGLSAESPVADVQKAMDGEFPLVYTTPEKLIPNVRKRNKDKLRWIAVDEAHCVSTWGSDFRRKYGELGIIRRVIPSVTVIAVTATAISTVEEDIITKLGMRNTLTFKGSLLRSNIALRVMPKPSGTNKSTHLAIVLNAIKEEARLNVVGSCIIFVATVAEVDDITKIIQKECPGVNTAAYHARLRPSERRSIEIKFMEGHIRIVVATIALSLGINHPHVRRIVQYGPPKSMEELYQKICRAGRDGQPAEAIMIVTDSEFDKFQAEFYSGGLTSEQRAVQNTSLNFLRSFAADNRCCRWTRMLEYFEEPSTPPCTTCDVCTSPTSVVDFTALARFVFCAIDSHPYGGMTSMLDNAFNLNNQKKKLVFTSASLSNNKSKNKRICMALLPLLVEGGYISRESRTHTTQGREVRFSAYSLSETAVSVLNADSTAMGMVVLPFPIDISLRQWLANSAILTDGSISTGLATPEMTPFSFVVTIELEVWYEMVLTASTDSKSPLPVVSAAPLNQTNGFTIQNGDKVSGVGESLLGTTSPPDAVWESFISLCHQQTNNMTMAFTRMMRTWPCGLRNRRNWCFLNVIMQAFAHSDIFLLAFLAKAVPIDTGFLLNPARSPAQMEKAEGFLDQLRKALSVISPGSPSYRNKYTPNDELYRSLPDPFSNGSQHDCSESYEAIINSLKDTRGNLCSVAHMASASFQINFMMKTTCQACHQSVTEEMVLYAIPLIYPNMLTPDDTLDSISLCSLLSDYFQLTTILVMDDDASSGVKCSNKDSDVCIAHRQTASRSAVLAMQPVQHLAISINQKFTAGTQVKSTTPVTFPSRLSLVFYDNEVGVPVNYTLYGFIHHLGRTRDNGHYIAHFRNSPLIRASEGDTGFGEHGWFCMNDELVTSVSENSIEAMANGSPPGSGRTATLCMLFYRLENTPYPKLFHTPSTEIPYQAPVVLSPELAKQIKDDNDSQVRDPEGVSGALSTTISSSTTRTSESVSFTGQGFGDINICDMGVCGRGSGSTTVSDSTEHANESASPSKTVPEPEKKPKVPRKPATHKWPNHKEDKGPFTTEASALAFMEELSFEGAGGTIRWRKDCWISLKRTTGDKATMLYRCGYSRSCNCPYRCRIRLTQSGVYYISIGQWMHAGHNCDLSQSVVPALVKSILTPTKVRLAPTALITMLKTSDAVKETDFVVNHETAKNIKSLHLRLKRVQDIGGTGIGTWGSLQKAISRITLNPVTEDETYRFGVICDPTAKLKNGRVGRLCAPLSTENLILNGYRVLQFGMPLQLLMDCEYSNTTFDGYATMLIGVMDCSQHFHVVSYALLNHEDETGQEHALRETKREVERMVVKYRGVKI